MIAIIPARGGSKRIKKKNTKLFCGQPIIKYSIDAAKESNLFQEIIVSTEDTSIANVAKRCGASVPSLRSKKNSGDHSTLADVMLEEISKLEVRGISAEYICLILATAPTISGHEIKAGLKALKKNKADTLVSVCEFSEPIGRALRLENGKIKMILDKNKFKRTQDLEKKYFDAGRLYWIKTDAFKKNKSFFCKNSCPFPVSNLIAQDIDDIDDWRLMELKYKLCRSDENK